MPDPTVTFLTAVHNGSRFLAEALDSVRRQRRADWECVIVDDASDDDTPEIIERYVRQDPERFRSVRRETSGGPYAAANTGLDVARGRYVARLDADDIALPERLDVQLAFLAQRPSLRACIGGWRAMDDAGAVEGGVRNMPCVSPSALPWGLVVVAGAAHSTALIERSALEEIGRYPDLPTSADLRTWGALSRRGWLGVVPEAVIHYRRHATQITSARAELQRHWSGVVLQEHLEALTGRDWSIDDVRMLRGVGRWERVPFRAGLALLDRWEAGWRADDRLDRAGRGELRRLGTRVRLRHQRTNGRRPIDVALGGISLARSQVSGAIG